MINHFNSNIAVTYSLNSAIFVQQLAQWSFINLANNKHIYDGLCWSYNTLDAYELIFPYWTRRQLERVISNAITEGLIVKENYNKNRYDRTCWYALTPKGMGYFPELITEKNLKTLYSSISPNGEMEFSEWCNVFHHTVTTIPTNNPTKDISKDISGNETNSQTQEEQKPEAKSKKGTFGINELQADNPHEINESMLTDWLYVRNAKKNKVTGTTWNKINKTLTIIKEKVGVSPQEAFETMVASGWQSLELRYFTEKYNVHDVKNLQGDEILSSTGEIQNWE